MNCIDLYSGIGGWTLGMKLSGIDHIKSFEWNKHSNRTHNMNFNTSTEEINIRKLDFDSLPEVGSIDFIVGSPPCTQFSFANKGGGGDIQDGLIDMYQFLSVVEYLKPKYWAMENVPRVKSILEKVLKEDEKFKKFKPLFNYLDVVDSSEYGLPQRRKRMIAGNFPFELFEAYKHQTENKTLGDVISALQTDPVVDPIYNYTLPQSEVTDHLIESPLTSEELRLNRESKEYHSIYNLMSFPEKTDRPSRTITSTCTRVSRESLVIEDKGNFRRLTVRERGVLMGFPISYQYYGHTYSEKIKMIGNAIPPVVTYYLFQSMLETKPEDLVHIGMVQQYVHEIPNEPIPSTPPDKTKSNYRAVRSFRLAIPGYRFGSGVRFELSNKVRKDSCKWSMKFYYGSSKKINEVIFNEQRFNSILTLLNDQNIDIDRNTKELQNYALKISSEALQERWIHQTEDKPHPYQVLDELGNFALEIKISIDNLEVSDEAFSAIVGDNLNLKLYENKTLVLSGILAGYIFNENIKK